MVDDCRISRKIAGKYLETPGKINKTPPEDSAARRSALPAIQSAGTTKSPPMKWSSAWEFAYERIQIALFHNTLGEADKMTDDLGAVCFANHLTKALGNAPCVKDTSMDLADESPARPMQLNEQHIAAIKKIVIGKMAMAPERLS